MSLRHNVIAGFLSQIYATLIGIVVVPMYLQYMGAEAYGLVGFFAMSQAWFSLLDIGLTPTIARETARHRGGATDALSYRQLVRVLETIFLAIAVVGGAAMLVAAGYIARSWLRVSDLPVGEVFSAVQLMAIAIALRWMAGLYRGAISGAERLVWLGGFNSAVATLRFVGVLPLLILVGSSPTLFFSYQLGVALVELSVLLFYAYRVMPRVPMGARLPWNWAPLKPVLRFSLTIAFTSSVWVFVTQTDKLVLSRLLPLADYGYFTLAVLVASAILIVSGPIGNAIMPRMARLQAEGAHAQMIQVYRQATQLVAVTAGTLSITVALCSEALLWAWTGSDEVAQQAAPILTLYALGNGVLAVAAFPYYLQFAKGDLRLHLIGNAAFVVLLLPLLVWSATEFGGVGAGYVWLGMNLFFFAAWLPFVHRKFEPGLNRRWYANDIAVIVAATACAGYAVNLVLPAGGSRMSQLADIVLVGLAALAAGALASSTLRARIRTFRHTPASLHS